MRLVAGARDDDDVVAQLAQAASTIVVGNRRLVHRDDDALRLRDAAALEERPVLGVAEIDRQSLVAAAR